MVPLFCPGSIENQKFREHENFARRATSCLLCEVRRKNCSTSRFCGKCSRGKEYYFTCPHDHYDKIPWEHVTYYALRSQAFSELSGHERDMIARLPTRKVQCVHGST